MRVLVLIDGEHYPPVTKVGVDAVRSEGDEVVGAILLGGREKLRAGVSFDVGEVRDAGDDPVAALAEEIDRLAPGAIVDLSDEPVVGYRERMHLASVALARGVMYRGADFRLDPPITEPALPVPTVAVIGTGKRTGKTAISGEVARIAKEDGLAPIELCLEIGPGNLVCHGSSPWLERASMHAGDRIALPICEIDRHVSRP